MTSKKKVYADRLYSLDILAVSKENQETKNIVKSEEVINKKEQPIKKIKDVKPKPIINNKSVEIPIKKVSDIKKEPANKKVFDTVSQAENYHYTITKTDILRNVEGKFNRASVKENVTESEDIKPLFDLENYSKYILSKIKDTLEYPFFARRRGIEGDVEVMITISQIGRLEKLEILKSSGYEILDKNTLELEGNIIFEQLPPETVSFPLKISYRLQ